MPRILIADDHPLFRVALTQAIRAAVEAARVDEADTLAAVHAALEVHADTDLVLLDLHMPGNHGLTGLAALRCRYPAVAVAVVSANEQPSVIRRALDHGAVGFIPKSCGLEELAEAIAAIMNCEEWLPARLREMVAAVGSDDADAELAARMASLTPQQFRVLEMVAEGRLNKQIADTLDIQERTVKAHLTAIFEKLEVRNRTQAGVALRQLELADPAQRVAD